MRKISACAALLFILMLPALSYSAPPFVNIVQDVQKILKQNTSSTSAVLDKVDTTRSTAQQSAEVTAILSATSATIANEVSEQVPVLRKYSPKIIGGDPVAYRQYPWQVALLQNHPPFRQFCGGSLIRANWVLTAAHCVDGGTLPSDLVVLIGTDFLDQGGQKQEVDEIIRHENYTDPVISGFDVALIKLKKASPETTIDIVDSTNEEKLAFSGVFGWVTGWGVTESGYPSIQLKEVAVRRIANDTCNSAQMYNEQITDTMLCAGYRIGKKDSCQGDSGGPLMAVNQKGGMIQFGIVSWGEGCAVENRPGVYTRIAALHDWIIDRLGE